MLPSIIIPVLNRGDLLRNVVWSLDRVWSDLLIIDNSDGKDESINRTLKEIERELESTIIIHQRNAGYSGSVNQGMKLTKPPWVHISNDVVLPEWTVAKLMEAHEQHPDWRMIGAGKVGFCCCLLTEQAIEEVGYFDENFYPAYCEDIDWWRRRNLLGTPVGNVEDIQVGHLGSQTIKSDQVLSEKNSQTHANNKDYYARKWGGPSGKETHLTPFGDPNWPVNKWVIDREHYDKNWRIWNGTPES